MKFLALPTTWALVTTSPWSSKTTPEPNPCVVWTCTPDGETAWIPSLNCCSRANGPVPADRMTTGADLGAGSELCPQPAATTVARTARTATERGLDIACSAAANIRRSLHVIGQSVVGRATDLRSAPGGVR